MPIAIEFEDGTLFGFQFCSASMVEVGFIEGSKIENFETKQQGWDTLSRLVKGAEIMSVTVTEKSYEEIDDFISGGLPDDQDRYIKDVSFKLSNGAILRLMVWQDFMHLYLVFE